MDDKKQFTVRLNAAINEAIAEYREMQEENGELLNTDKKILESLVDTAISKFRPYKENSQKVKDLQAKNERLTDENKTLTELVETLRKKDDANNSTLEQLQQKLLQSDNLSADIILRKKDISIVHLKLLEKYLASSKAKSMFVKLNDNGKYDGFFDKIEPNNYGKLLLNAFLASAMGKTLPAVVSNRAIKNAIDKQLQNLGL